MADRIEPFAVPVPAGTAIAAPQRTAMPFADGVVERIVITVPPGPSGFVGFQLAHKGQSVIPYTGSTFIVADDRIIDWPISNFPTATGWELVAYNTDVFVHTLYLEFLINEIPTAVAAPVTLLPIGQ